MAGRIPQDFIDQLLARTDIVELVDARVPLRKNGRNYAACCPFHTEKTPSFTVSPDKQFYYCFGCGANGSAIGFLMEFDRMDFVDAVEELARKAGLDVPREPSGGGPAAAPDGQRREQARQAQARRDELFETLAAADRFFRAQIRRHPERERAVGYLRGRGLDGQTVQRFGIGYAPPAWDALATALSERGFGSERLVAAGLLVEKDTGRAYDRFRDRVVFPIRDRRGRTVGFGARALSPEATPKYLNSPETEVFHKGRELYGLYDARQDRRALTRLLVVEGYMDVVALTQFGIDYAVATLGTSTTGEHIEQLFRHCPEVVFCYDGDRAGKEAAWRALEQTLGQLRDGRQAGFLFLPEGEDPDTLVRQEGPEAFTARIEEQTVPLSDYLFAKLSEGIDTASLDGQARLTELARPLFEKIPDGTFRELLTERLSRQVSLPAERLRGRLFGGGGGTGHGAGGRAGSAAGAPPGRHAPPVPPRDVPVKHGSPRHAIALLLSSTALARGVGEEQLRQLRESERARSEPGVAFLVELIETLRSDPHINTAALMERYRGSEAGRGLEILSRWQPLVDESLFGDEFAGILARLCRTRADRHRILLDRFRRREITPEELEELKQYAQRPPAQG